MKRHDEIGVRGAQLKRNGGKSFSTLTQLKTANDSLKQDIDKERELDRQRMMFFSAVSHELKTPIALIQGYAEGLIEGMAEEKESRDYYCEVIMDEANKMNKMVRQLLTLNALESGMTLFLWNTLILLN